jgi:protein disulfide-isomerase
MKLQKEVLKTPEFAKWAKDNVVLVELDFPRRAPQSDELKAQNANLQQFFQVRDTLRYGLLRCKNCRRQNQL